MLLFGRMYTLTSFYDSKCVMNLTEQPDVSDALRMRETEGTYTRQHRDADSGVSSLSEHLRLGGTLL